MNDLTWLDLDPAFDFTRENDGCVWATVQMPLGLTLTLSSDEPDNPRSWSFDEAELELGPDETGVGRNRYRVLTLLAVRHSDNNVGYACDLGRALAREWDRYVQMEQNLPYAARATGTT